MTDTLAAALVAAQGEFPKIPKDKTVTVKGSFTYSYADLPGVLEQVRPIMAKHGLGHAQDVTNPDGRILITTDLIHVSGETRRFGPLELEYAAGNAQAMGSAITYGRRYALLAALGIAADDDDGQAASVPTPVEEPPKRTRKPKDEPAVGRTPEERKIRTLMLKLPTFELETLQQAFRHQYGMGLAQLPVSKHQEALVFVEATIAELMAPPAGEGE